MTRRDASEPMSVGAILSELARCPDCGSTVKLADVEPNLVVLDVEHDPCCPWLRKQDK